ncbi:MAG TPA: ATP-binding protein [Humisphaera sp.]|nr:ATP-binding protein [Humisphaera sp.]
MLGRFHSIRWTLQIWHAGILLAALASFGAALYYGTTHARFKQVDTEIDAAAQVIASRLGGRPPPPRPQGEFDDGPYGPQFDPNRPPPDGSDGPPEGPPEGRQFDGPPRDGQPPESPPPRGRGRGGPPPQGPPRGGRGRGPILPPPFAQRFGAIESAGGYYIVWDPQDRIRIVSQTGLDVPRPPRAVARPAPPIYRWRGQLREVYITDPQNNQILVGRSIARELDELHQLAWLLCVCGGGVMAIGLAGGWMLSRKAVKPIAAMSQAAAEISASNLSRRINTNGTQNELTDLARVLNSTFDRLETAFAQQVRFTADASHELRTPLSVIHSQAELALSKERSAAEYRQTIEACLRAARRMKSLAESLLMLARADAGKLELKNEECDLETLTQECIDMVQPLAEQKRVTIESRLRPAHITGDSFRIAQVITNLLTNAIHYNREGGTITVTLEDEPTGALLTIADTGVGIPPDDARNIFQRFFRVDKARSRQAGGSGLGLAICKSILDAHGGSIDFQSEVEKGTTFRVRLPKSVAARQDART